MSFLKGSLKMAKKCELEYEYSALDICEFEGSLSEVATRLIKKEEILKRHGHLSPRLVCAEKDWGDGNDVPYLALMVSRLETDEELKSRLDARTKKIASNKKAKGRVADRQLEMYQKLKKKFED